MGASNAQSEEAADAARKPIAGFADGPGGPAVWLDAGKPVTACPKCHGAMAVRLWLSSAECQHCHFTLRLTAAQEQQALALLRPVGGAAPAGETAAIPQPADSANAATYPIVIPAIGQPTPASHPSSLISDPSSVSTEIGAPLPTFGRFLVSWLISVVVHMVLIIVLGFWLIEGAARPDRIVLAATVSDTRRDDELDELTMSGSEIEPPDELALPLASDVAVPGVNQELTDSVTTIEQPPGDLLADADIKKLPVGSLSPGQILAGRDAAFRGQLVAREGGTSQSEAAVGRALKWLQAHQQANGSWSLNHFADAGDCKGRCGNPGVESDTAATALALLPFLGAGQTHLRGDYTETVARGLRALMDLQHPDGDLRGAGSGNMYAHGQATIALCEAYALTQLENLRQPAQHAVDFIVAAQHEAGGWRYRPGEPGDLSVVGWQMMALRSAQMAYLKVPEETFLKASRFLNSVQDAPSKGLYGYMPGSGPTPVMTAEGLLCRQYSGWRRNHPVLLNGVAWLEGHQLPKADQANMYYWYYGTQVMHHMGGAQWDKWNSALRDLLISLQSGGGHEAGSWAPLGGHDQQGGRLYTTALAACTLEVYYRHLPLYRGAATGSAEPTPRHKR